MPNLPAPLAARLLGLGLALLADPTALNVAEPVPQSTRVAFFHSYPRFSHDNRFATDTSYFVSLGLAAVPWLIVALFCAVVGLCINICCGGVRRRRIVRAISSRFNFATQNDLSDSSQSTTGSLKSPSRTNRDIFTGALLFTHAFMLLGLGFAANYSFRAGIFDTVAAANGGLSDIIADANGVLGFSQSLLNGIDETIASQPLISDILSSFSGLPQQLSSAQSALAAFTPQLQEIITVVDDVSSSVRRVGHAIYFTFVVLYVVIVLGFLLLFSTNARRASSQKLAMAIFLVPLTLSWISVGLVTSAGLAAGDSCASLDEFHRIVLVQSGTLPPSAIEGINPADNILVAKNLQCPAQMSSGSTDELDTLVESIKFILGNSAILDSVLLPVVNNIVMLPRDITSTELQTTRTWLLQKLNDLTQCTSVVNLAGRLNYAGCHPRGPVLALFVTWVSLLSLALALTIFFAIAQLSKYNTAAFITPRYVCFGSSGSSVASDESGLQKDEESAFAAGPPRFSEAPRTPDTQMQEPLARPQVSHSSNGYSVTGGAAQPPPPPPPPPPPAPQSGMLSGGMSGITEYRDASAPRRESLSTIATRD